MKIVLKICLSILLVSAISPVVSGQAGTEPSDQEHFTRSFTVNTGSSLSVENYKGVIHVTGTAGNQVQVNVNKRFEGNDNDRKWWMENTRVSFDNSSDRVRVRVEYPSTTCFFSCNEHTDYTASVDLTIQVPTKTNLDIDGYKPEIKLASVDGDIHVKSYKSPIEIDSTTGAIDISTYKESVNLRDVNIRGNFNLKMEKGDATIAAKSFGKEAEIEMGKGSVVLRVPRNTGLAVDYRGSRRSSLHSDLPITSEAGFSSGELRGSINGGGTTLRLRTDRGSFTIEALQ
jgi:hypothetical protein